MTKLERNAPCHCGSGIKYKRCCADRDIEQAKANRPSGRFRFEPGSYGAENAFMPSFLCFMELASGQWVEHISLVNPDSIHEQAEEAADLARKTLETAHARRVDGASVEAIAEVLVKAGYKKISGFKKAAEQPQP